MMQAIPGKYVIKQGEMLCSTTIRIETESINGAGAGTGFYYSVKLGNDYVPIIVTNKHVIKNAKRIKFVFTKADKFGNRLDDFLRIEYEITKESVTDHPSKEVDLCAITISHIVEDCRKNGVEIYTHFITKETVPTEITLGELDAIEDVLMVGYPNGLWDEMNNMPLVRKGITATSPKIHYNGSKEFLIDAAVFPGSSGSPVFYLDKRHKTEIKGNLMGYKVWLLGVLYAGPTQVLEGSGIITAIKIDTVTQIMINIGHVIKAERLLELETEVLKRNAE